MSGDRPFDAHQARHAVFAARLTRLTQIQKDTKSSVYAMTGGEGPTDQIVQPRVLVGVIRHGIPEPGVETAARDVERCTHSSNIVFAKESFYKFIGTARFERAADARHGLTPVGYDGTTACP
jgi:hypothetical protein